VRRPSRLKLIAGSGARETLLELLVEKGGVEEELARAAITRGGAFVAGRRERDPTALLRAGEKVEVSFAAAEAAALDRARILHLDETILAIDKPAGVAAQEELSGGPSLPDLCSALLAELGERDTQALLVHRLDKGTSGVTLLARTRRAQQRLLEDFRERRVRKEYRALVTRPPSRSRIDDPIGGQPASTQVRLLEQFALGAHVAAFPETGRTHQVRLHLEAAAAPLLGDRRYGGPAFLTRPDGARLDLERPLLHALALELPGRRIEAPLPADFSSALAWLAKLASPSA
jgi:23S rRNA pseudouridine1911/1915/1917 synthase